MMDRLSRQELLREIEERDTLIAKLKSELANHREYFHNRKIAVSAPETANNQEPQATQQFFHKDQKTFEIIESALLANEFLCQLEKCEIEEMIRSMRPADAAKGSIIIRQGEYGSVLYVLEEGRVQVSKDDRFIRVMEAPCVFGELAILYHCERTASVKASTFCSIWAIDRQIFHSIMVSTAKSKHNTAFAYLKKCTRFSRLSDDQLNIMAGLAREEYWNFRTEIDKPQLPGRIYIITNGRMTLRRMSHFLTSGPDLESLGPGDVFGEVEALNALLSPAPSPTRPYMEVRNSESRKSHNLLPKIPQQLIYEKSYNKRSHSISTTDDNSHNSVEECYFVDSVEGCHLLAMLVDQLARSLDLTKFVASNGGNATSSTASPNIPKKVVTNCAKQAAAGANRSAQIAALAAANAQSVKASKIQYNRASATSSSSSALSALTSHSIKEKLMSKPRSTSVQRDDEASSSNSSSNSENDIIHAVDEVNKSVEGGVSSQADQDDENDYGQIDLVDLKTIATLGVGGFGRVNLVKKFDAEKVFALKILNKAHVREMNQQEHVLNERNILISCHTDFIVRLYKTYRDSERLYMLLEYCPGGEVWTMLHKWGRFDENTTRFYCAAALEAFDYLHRRFIIYRDLKPENMLLDANGIPKLVDFGFAKRLKSDADRTWTFCGTAEYVSPEIILNKGQDIAVDIWSLGIFMFELISGTPPFASTDPMHTYNSILRGVQMLVWPRYMSDAAKSLICKFCRRDPTQRLGYGRIEDARKDAWFGAFDFEAFRNHTMRPPIIPKVRSPTDTQNFDRYPSMDNFLCGHDESGWDVEF